MFSNHFITNFPQNAPVKKILKIGQYLAKIWTKLCGLLFGGTLYNDRNTFVMCASIVLIDEGYLYWVPATLGYLWCGREPELPDSDDA